MPDRGVGRFVTGLTGVAALVLVAAGCSTSSSSEFTGNRLDNPYQAPDIELTDTSGEPFSLVDDTDKPLTLVFFGYTHCPDICPMVMNSLAAGLNRLDDADRDDVDMVFITTDPARDDEAALEAYLDHYGEGFIGLTGDLERIIEVGDPLAIYVNDGKKLPTGGYDLGGHTTVVLGIDADDEAVVLWSQDTSASQFADDIQTLLDEGP